MRSAPERPLLFGGTESSNLASSSIAATGFPDGPPVKLTALFERERTGQYRPPRSPRSNETVVLLLVLLIAMRFATQLDNISRY